MVNYYEVLEVERHAELPEIKRAFRRLLKRFHPDRNQSNCAWAEQQTRRLVEAYHVLSDERRRKYHDHQLRLRRLASSHGRRLVEPLDGRDSEAGLCRRILGDLLNGNGTRATRTYEQLRGDRRTFDFYPFLSLKDHLDCKFLLGEEYERQGELREALILYEEVYREEKEGPRLRYFFDEVQERIVNIYCQQIARKASPEEAIECFRHALDLELPDKDRAEIRKRLAETLLKTGDEESARRELVEALRLRPSLKGVQRLCARLGVAAAAI
ncbi:MAG: J domain-containing protein [Candidatus Brocadiia bacterium]